MSHVHHTWESGDGPEVQIVEPVLAAGEGEHHGIGWGGFHELPEVSATRLGTVASSDQEEVVDLSGSHGFDHLVGDGDHEPVSESGGEGAGSGGTLAEAPEFQGLVNHRCEVAISDVGGAGIPDGAGGEYPVPVGLGRRDQAVGRVQERDGGRIELLPLVLPI